MKKEYCKPVIEGEFFEANEYVAACYIVTCVGRSHSGKSTYVKRDHAPTADAFDNDGDGFAYLVNLSSSIGYSGRINGESGEYSGFHPCTVQSAAGTAHPNASV